jgi:hypothetical protein
MIAWLDALHWGWWAVGVVLIWALIMGVILRCLGWASKGEPDEHNHRYDERIG